MKKIWLLDNEDTAHLIELEDDIEIILEYLIKQVERDLKIEIVDYWIENEIEDYDIILEEIKKLNEMVDYWFDDID
jgi:hypothetical protein